VVAGQARVEGPAVPVLLPVGGRLVPAPTPQSENQRGSEEPQSA